MKTVKQGRSPALDVVRCVALLSVVCIHFFLNCGYYQTPMLGARMYLMTLMRAGCMVCVPLFLMLSGYLLRNKKPGKGYCLALIRTLAIYVLASAVCGIYRIYCLNTEMTVQNVITRLLIYDLAEYGWYVEMYIGLFLMIPFLNAAYHGLETRRHKQYLILALLFLTAGPSIGNTDPRFPVVPDWWANIYPLTYYFIGCYLREFPLKLKPAATAGLLLAAVIAAGTYNYYKSYNHTFIWGVWQDWGSLVHVVLAVLTFHFLTALDYSAMPAFLVKCFARMSDWSLGAYLVSWIFDNRYYGILNAQIPQVHLRLNYFLPVVFAVYFSSLALSAVLHGIYALTLGRLVSRKKQAV